MTRRTSIALRSALAATVGTVCLLASTGSNAGVYAHRSHVTGRPTLLPRYYGGGYDTGGYDDAYAAVGYPGGYYGGYVNPFRSYRGGPKSGWWD